MEIAVLSDHRSHAVRIAEMITPIAECYIVGSGENWSDFDDLRGIIADFEITRAEFKQCLGIMSQRFGFKQTPLIYLTRRNSDQMLIEASAFGATACLSSHLETKNIVTAIFSLICPNKTLTELMVERRLFRAGILFNSVIHAGKFDPLPVENLEAEVDPILHVIREAGIKKWLDLLHIHDDMTVRHCLHVSGLVANFALYLGFAKEDTKNLVRAALLHDVGKSKISKDVLNKPGQLTAHELREIRSHPAVGHELLLSSAVSDATSLDVTRHHHEMLDGTGYPDGLRGDEISDAVRIVTICDIYAALTETRPYRKAMDQTKALQILVEMTPLKLERALVRAFELSLDNVHPH
ncbi:HD-GYP domain-containing protein [Methylobacterium sp. Leaf85]|uniref:HD-GYP domain-containing protein n=1 Tax=Methylobacterium sp. Leaf85 TaxID=1736241 RepID=UPI0012E8EAD4|nr:HD domain-containing phosphohydrolase [Methylobacterium sp. Leaf85]